MLNLRFRQKNEMKLEYAPRITQVDWDRHADAVKNMHEERKTRREILEALSHERDFRPSMAQLNTHMRKRKLRVYGKAGDVYALEATEAELSLPEDQILPIASVIVPVTRGIVPAEHQVMWAADCGSRAEVAPASTSPQTRAMDDTSFADMLDLAPLNFGDTTTDGTQAYRQGAEENEDEVRGRRMSDAGDKSIRGTIEDVENGADFLVKHEQDRTPGQHPYIVPREASVCSFRSHHSDSSSIRAFREFAADVSRAAQLRHQASQSSLLSLTIKSEESWNFDSVTGMPSDGLALCNCKVPSAADWEPCWIAIVELYIGKKWSLQNIQDHLTNCHDFEATPRMYRRQLLSWASKRNWSERDWMRVALSLRDREVAGKTQPVYIQFRNRTWSKNEYLRFLQSRGVSEAEFLEAATASLGSSGWNGVEDTPRVIIMDEPMEQEGIMEMPWLPQGSWG